MEFLGYFEILFSLICALSIIKSRVDFFPTMGMDVLVFLAGTVSPISIYSSLSSMVSIFFTGEGGLMFCY